MGPGSNKLFILLTECVEQVNKLLVLYKMLDKEEYSEI